MEGVHMGLDMKDKKKVCGEGRVASWFKVVT
jgi:hypothetical protein